jgi:hypothetical protein
MSREEPDVPPETRGLSGEKTQNRPSITGGPDGVATAEQTVYRGRRDPAAPVGEEYTVTVNGDECLPKRYDLLSASPSGFSWSFGGSGPSQLSIALLAHAFDDEFACEHHQQFKREVVANLPEDRWTLRTSELDAWRREVVGGD